MEQITEQVAFIRKEFALEPEMQFAEQQIANLSELRADSFALERCSNEFFRQLDIISIIVQAAAKYMDRTDDFTLEPTISLIGKNVRELRNNFVKQ
jgi:hypothetical protein